MRIYTPEDLELESIINRIYNWSYEFNDSVAYGIRDKDISRFYRICSDALRDDKRIGLNIGKLVDETNFIFNGYSPIFDKDFLYKDDANPSILYENDNLVSISIRKNGNDKLYFNTRVNSIAEFPIGKISKAKISSDVKSVDYRNNLVGLLGEIILMDSRNGLTPKYRYSDEEFELDRHALYNEVSLRQLSNLNKFTAVVAKRNR